MRAAAGHDDSWQRSARVCIRMAEVLGYFLCYRREGRSRLKDVFFLYSIATMDSKVKKNVQGPGFYFFSWIEI